MVSVRPCGACSSLSPDSSSTILKEQIMFDGLSNRACVSARRQVCEKSIFDDNSESWGRP